MDITLQVSPFPILHSCRAQLQCFLVLCLLGWRPTNSKQTRSLLFLNNWNKTAHAHCHSSISRPWLIPLHNRQVQSLDQEDHLEKEMATHSSVLAWRSPWREGACWVMVQGVAESRTWLSTYHMHNMCYLSTDYSYVCMAHLLSPVMQKFHESNYFILRQKKNTWSLTITYYLSNDWMYKGFSLLPTYTLDIKPYLCTPFLMYDM